VGCKAKKKVLGVPSNRKVRVPANKHKNQGGEKGGKVTIQKEIKPYIKTNVHVFQALSKLIGNKRGVKLRPKGRGGGKYREWLGKTSTKKTPPWKEFHSQN